MPSSLSVPRTEGDSTTQLGRHTHTHAQVITMRLATQREGGKEEAVEMNFSGCRVQIR